MGIFKEIKIKEPLMPKDQPFHLVSCLFTTFFLSVFLLFPVFQPFAEAG